MIYVSSGPITGLPIMKENEVSYNNVKYLRMVQKLWKNAKQWIKYETPKNLRLFLAHLK